MMGDIPMSELKENGEGGIRTPIETSEKTAFSDQGGAKSGAVVAADADPKLQAALEALAAMTPEERAAIIAGILKTDVR